MGLVMILASSENVDCAVKNFLPSLFKAGRISKVSLSNENCRFLEMDQISKWLLSSSKLNLSFRPSMLYVLERADKLGVKKLPLS